MRLLVLERNPLGTCLLVCTSAACNSGYIKVEYTVEYIKSISFQDWFFLIEAESFQDLWTEKKLRLFTEVNHHFICLIMSISILFWCYYKSFLLPLLLTCIKSTVNLIYHYCFMGICFCQVLLHFWCAVWSAVAAFTDVWLMEPWIICHWLLHSGGNLLRFLQWA